LTRQGSGIREDGTASVGGADRLRILIAGGGTGGHVIPGLAIAREMRDRYGAEVRFVGTARGLETRLVPEAGFGLELMEVGQLKGVSMAVRARTVAELPIGIRRCMKLLRGLRPHVVVGVGGYASGPTMMAAILMRVPTLAYEPNAVPGLANRIVGQMVSAAAVNFEAAGRYFRRARVTGIPVREEFFDVRPRPVEGAGVGAAIGMIPEIESVSEPPHLLVFGGSQGARIFNEVLPKILGRMVEMVPGLTILHQAGAKQAAATAEAYRASGADARRWEVAAFVDDMPGAFERADLILCRSGATTVAELAAAGRAAVLVPFPGAADDHQMRNAEVLARAGAADLLRQGSDELMQTSLLGELSRLLRDGGAREQMATRVRAFARREAVGEIGGMIAELAGR